MVGGGVTGLAAAAALSAAGRSVCIIDRHPRPGLETSTHNSGVIHAGIYYPTGSLKATLCVDGAEQLYRFCAEHGVPHERCGKFIAASDEAEIPELEALRSLGEANGVAGLTIVDCAELQRREPHMRAVAALWSPGSGRVDADALVRTLLRLAEAHHAIWLRSTSLLGADRTAEGFAVRTERETIAARTIVNAAGLHADDVSRLLGGETFRIYPVRGEYAELRPSRRGWVNGLVYPLPHPSGHGLGVHFTKTTAGAVLLGPTARYQERKDDYESDRLPIESFVAPARTLLPALTIDDLVAGGTGIRPKFHPPEEKFADFFIRHDADVPGLVHAAGIDSPGLTACLAVAARVGALVDEIL